MSRDDTQYQRQVRCGQAINLAVSLAQNEKMGEHAPDVLARARELIPELIEMIDLTQAENSLTQAFPGSTVEPVETFRTAGDTRPVEQPQFVGGQPTYSQPPQQQYAPGSPGMATPQPAPFSSQASPAPIPNQSRGGGGNWKQQKAEEAFRAFVADTTQWEDVRSSKRGPDSPDFRHKWQNDPPSRDGKVYKTSLWLRDAPEWSKPQLQQWGLI